MEIIWGLYELLLNRTSTMYVRMNNFFRSGKLTTAWEVESGKRLSLLKQLLRTKYWHNTTDPRNGFTLQQLRHGLQNPLKLTQLRNTTTTQARFPTPRALYFNYTIFQWTIPTIYQPHVFVLWCLLTTHAPWQYACAYTYLMACSRTDV